MDFTLKMYKKLLQTFLDKDYHIFSFNQFILLNSPSSPFINSSTHQLPNSPTLILRHDVDRMPQNALKIAKLEHKLGITSTYYFRTISQTLKPDIIKEISDMGHEIGYHYENMAKCNGNFEMAIEDFKNNLCKLREIAPIHTICMHGSPRSRWDAKDLWKKYDYRDFGIMAEPYMDIDFNEVFYLTDTGRRWDGWKYSIRDKIQQQEKWINEGLTFHSTSEIIDAIKKNKFPQKALITTHPQRWNDNPILWFNELFSQNIKNIVKKLLITQNKLATKNGYS